MLLNDGQGSYVRVSGLPPVLGVVSDVEVGDVDGDGTEEPLRYEPSSGEFLVGDEPVFVFPSSIRPDPEGKNGLRTFTGDFDGDGRLDFAIHVRSKSEFRIATRTGNTRVQRMGNSTDLPLVGDFDKDGSDEIAIYSQGMRAFYYSNFERAGMVYGARMRLNYTGSFQAMSGDTDGDGRDEFILYHPSAEFLISQIGSTSTIRFTNADSYSTGLIADADNDGKDDFITYSVGFKRWSAYKRTGSQILRKSQIAATNDVPMTCDIDGDGRTELIFFRRDEGVFDMTGLEAIEVSVRPWFSGGWFNFSGLKFNFNFSF